MMRDLFGNFSYCLISIPFCLEFKLVIDIYYFLQPIKVVQHHINTEELYSYLKEFIHMLYFR